MSNFTYNAGSSLMTSGGTTDLWASGTIKARLVLASVTPTIDDTSMTGMTAATYSGGDPTLSNKTKTTQTSPTNRVMFDNTADLTFTGVTGAAIGYVIVYQFISNDAGSKPLFKADVSVTPNGSDIVVAFNSAGVAYTQQ